MYVLMCSVPGQPVDPALHKNESELGVLVLPVPLKMLPDGDGLLDQVVAVLGQLGGHALALQDTQNLVASDEANLKNRKDTINLSKPLKLGLGRGYYQKIL